MRGSTVVGCIPYAVEPLSKGHFGGDINSANLFFVERGSPLRGSKCIVGIILDHKPCPL